MCDPKLEPEMHGIPVQPSSNARTLLGVSETFELAVCDLYEDIQSKVSIFCKL